MRSAATRSQNSPQRLATASIVGTTLEYYDFAVYNTLAALVFNRLLFPSFDPLSGTILAFSTFAVGYFSRRIGGLIFGHLGGMAAAPLRCNSAVGLRSATGVCSFSTATMGAV